MRRDDETKTKEALSMKGAPLRFPYLREGDSLRRVDDLAAAEGFSGESSPRTKKLLQRAATATPFTTR